MQGKTMQGKTEERMPNRNDPVPFEEPAIRYAISELAANGAGYVRLGALKLMTSIMGMTRDNPPGSSDPQLDQRLSNVLDEVEAALAESLEQPTQNQVAPVGADVDADAQTEADADAGDEQDEQDQQEEEDDDEADEEDEPP